MTILNQQSKKFPQIFASLSAAGGAFAIGAALGWPAPAGPQLVDRTLAEDERFFEITQTQFDWAASIITIGCAISCLPIGVMMKKFGRKSTMLSLVVPFMIGWALVIWAQNFAMLMVGRVFIGLAGGAFCVAAPQYSAETAQKEIRGIVGTFFQVLINCGILFVYIVGAFVSVFWMSVICAIVPIIFGIVFFFMPESPLYLVIEKRDKEAVQSYKWLRGSHYDPYEEIEEIKNEIAENDKNQISFSEATQTEIASDLQTIIIGSVLVVATLLGTFLVDRVGRKILLALSSFFMGLTLISLGTYFFLLDMEYENIDELAWLPLTSLSIFLVAFSIGYGPIPWLMLSEIYSREYNAVASPITGSLSWFLAFTVTSTFGFISDAIGIGGTFWIFAGATFVGFIFTLMFVFETKAKSKFSPTCPRDITIRKLSQTQKQYIVDLHNYYRSQVAYGLTTSYLDEKQFPTASRMMKLQWEEEQAVLASLHLKTCLSHDPCHNTFYNTSSNRLIFSGQNIAFLLTTGTRYSVEEVLWYSAANWFRESQATPVNLVDSISFANLSYVVGHFTQMVYDKNIRVGCAIVEWTENEGNKKLSRLTCNYLKANMANEPLYSKGDVCSDCKVCDYDDFIGLCVE
ncbi:CLUMA_CG020871, isoform A [Clunio marinus]|uniref:CLUMA_CG020871, isoform A n=1 Tax=Clunio marinus TaxID=568069 RepID=A0A1J1J781_9DIPT|nr:CLUMA_CG020871, isoform A [Clunio marinus]